ncbi:hypothetical protein CHU00_17585 [Sphingobacterium cellulitidis]|uniref:SDH family Clp fold serine proteinase n=1 Tax=Sphingobacterium cellulitidis TaxID=1768011 RepID=UPI000B93A346|nr:hypothetical protein [Sphingobacterium cellulitidis]OYD44321.1 hypothetical protein CHU00_17585 [Sphingobacterium cellulitidis]
MKKPKSIQHQLNQKSHQNKAIDISLYEHVKPGKEYGSIIEVVANIAVNVNPILDLSLCLNEIEVTRGRPCILYAANLVNSKISTSISIDYSDDLPFSELVNTIPKECSEIDVIIATPGGSGIQAAKFVEKLRSRFSNVGIIIPDMAMSAGTIFAMSGDEIIMTQNSYIGPIDPQVPNRDGRYVPAQALNVLISEIQKRGEVKLKSGQQPDWSDLQILSQLDPKDLGDAINASNYSIELVENYLKNYKFRTWVNHSDGRIVTEDEKSTRAKEIASQLCDHTLWKSHSRGITREQAETVCKLKITKSEDINLDLSIKKLWAILYWSFENTPIFKIFLSKYYSLMRNDRLLMSMNK